MSSIRELRLVANLRPDLDDREAIQESFQEILTDLAAIKEQWNQSVYPILGSLPQGRRAVARIDREIIIDPEVNGLDGSQVYMDMTARIGELGGLLHNGTRPKTIKEVVLEVYQATLARVNLVEQLLNNVNVANASYDDTEVRAWIRQLAGNTWDVDEDTIGDPFNAANFTGDPEKSVTTSIWQRVLNTRHLVGIEGEALTEQDLTVGGLLAATNYIAADTSIIDALITLDAQVFAGGAALEWQDVYDNSTGSQTIDMSALDEEVNVLGLDDTTTLFRYQNGGIAFDSDDFAPSTFVQAAWLTGRTDGDATDANYELRLFTVDQTDDDYETFRISHRAGSAIAKADELVEAYIGKPVSSADEQFASMYIGREALADGGEPFLTLSGYNNGSNNIGEIYSPLRLHLRTGSQLVFDATSHWTTLVGGNTTLNSDLDFSIYTTFGDILIDTLTNGGGTIVLASNTTTTINSTDKFLMSTAADAQFIVTDGLDIDAGDDIQIDTSSGHIYIRNNDTTLYNGAITIEASGVGDGGNAVHTTIEATGDYHHIGLIASAGATYNGVYAQADDVILYGIQGVDINCLGSGGWAFRGANAAWTQGIIFQHASGPRNAPDVSTIIGDGEIGKIFYHENGFADAKWQSASGDEDGLVLEAGAVKVTKNAPFIIWDETDGGAGVVTTAVYGSSIESVPVAGYPNVDAIYKENIIKSKGVITVDPSLGLHQIPYASTKDAFNVLIDGDRTPPNTTYYYPGYVVVFFLTPMPDDDYSVTMSYRTTVADVLNLSIFSQSTTGFVAHIKGWNSGTPDFEDVDATYDPFDFHWQVV